MACGDGFDDHIGPERLVGGTKRHLQGLQCALCSDSTFSDCDEAIARSSSASRVALQLAALIGAPFVFLLFTSWQPAFVSCRPRATGAPHMDDAWPGSRRA
jgi:hypothetical protein